MLRRLPAAALEALLATFNSLWETGTFPAAWREATVIPILKPGKSGLDPLHYRPISLTSSFCKLMEKMVNVRLSWYLERHGILTNAQCGFRKHRTAVDHILVVDTEARASFAQKKHLGALFFDIEAAYDTVLRPVILRKLFKYGIRGCMGFFLSPARPQLCLLCTVALSPARPQLCLLCTVAPPVDHPSLSSISQLSVPSPHSCLLSPAVTHQHTEHVRRSPIC